jgi:hypothetical protein
MIAWSVLTRMPTKAHLYQHETHFREALGDVAEVLGDAAPEVLWRSALLMVKPDGIATAKLAAVHGFLAEHDLTVIAVQPFEFDRVLGRELWRFQLTLATLDRLAVNDLVLRAGPALVLLLRSDDGHDLPATVRLSSLKGKPDLSEQVPGTLRHVIQQPNRLCSMIHCADEPADLIRELGLLFDGSVRRRLLRRLAAGVLAEEDRQRLDDALRRDAQGGVVLDRNGALNRLAQAVTLAGQDPAKARLADMVLPFIEQMRNGQPVPWRALSRQIDDLNIEIDQWDLVIVASSFVVEDEPGAFKILGNPDPSGWRTGSPHPGRRAAAEPE